MVARLGPGSPPPASPAEVEALLRMVPAVAFFPELDALPPAPLRPGPLTPQAIGEALEGDDGQGDRAWLPRVIEALRSLEARALAEQNGGLRFLAVTLRHFLDAGPQRVSPAEHPLVVALFARADARHGGRPDHPNEVARVLDRW